jgi:hypothetical protein
VEGLGYAVPYDAECPNGTWDWDHRINLTNFNQQPRRYRPRCPVHNVYLGETDEEAAVVADEPTPSIVDIATNVAAKYAEAAAARAAARGAEKLARRGVAIEAISRATTRGAAPEAVEAVWQKAKPWVIGAAAVAGVAAIAFIALKAHQARRRR